MNNSYDRRPDRIWRELRKVRLPSTVVSKASGLTTATCALSVLAVLYNAYRNTMTRLREAYRPSPVPDYQWVLATVRASLKYIVSRTGYSKGQVVEGIKQLILADYVAKDSSQRFAVNDYTLLDPRTGHPLQGVDPSIREGNPSAAYTDILVANGLHYFTIPVCLFVSGKKGTVAPYAFCTMGGSVQSLYITLSWLATQHQDSQYETTWDELRTLTHLGTVTLKKALGLLEARRLVWDSSVTARRILVNLRHPVTGDLLHHDSVRTELDPRGNRTNYYETTRTGSKRATFRMSPKEAESLFLQLIEEARRTVRPEKNGAEWKFACPFHADTTPSCNYNPGLGCFQCFGCQEKGTSYKLLMKLADLAGKSREETIRQIAAHQDKSLEYVPPDQEAIRISSYCDKQGRLVKQEVRYPDLPDGSKDIRQRRPGANGEFVWSVKDIKPMLYNLPYLEHAGVVVICEGPKDADTVTDLCLSGARYAVVGTTSGGAATWDDSLVRCIPRTKKVVIMPDEDEPGSTYADAVERSLESAGIDYRRISFAGTGCKDVSAYVAWYSVEDLVRLIGPDWVHMPDGTRLTQEPVYRLTTGASIAGTGTDVTATT